MFSYLYRNLRKINKNRLSNKTILTLLLIVAMATGTVNAYAEGLFEVRVVTDGNWEVFDTVGMTVSEFFDKQGIKLTEEDIVDRELTSPITEDTFIYINKAENINFVIDDKEEIVFSTNEHRLGVAVTLFGEKQGEKYYLDEGQSRAQTVVKDMIVNVKRYKEVSRVIQEEIPFDTKIIENNDLYTDTENILTKGVAGNKEVSVNEIYKGDVLENTKIVSTNITKDAITQVIEKGTKKVPTLPTQVGEVLNNSVKTKQGVFKISKKIAMKSTAYTAGFKSTGKTPSDSGYGVTASGQRAKVGVVAVDTNIIPFGTKLYIEGYGVAVAGDTGGAIKGNKVDVFLNDYNDAVKYGVRYVDVYVLGDKI